MREWLIFVGVTVVLGGLASVATGRAVAKTWRRPAQLGFYVLLIALAVRFLSFALFAAPLLCLECLARDLLVLLAVGFTAYRLVRTRQLARQYPWAFGTKRDEPGRG
jgi:hypothetical protein